MRPLKNGNFCLSLSKQGVDPAHRGRKNRVKSAVLRYQKNSPKPRKLSITYNKTNNYFPKLNVLKLSHRKYISQFLWYSILNIFCNNSCKEDNALILLVINIIILILHDFCLTTSGACSIELT